MKKIVCMVLLLLNIFYGLPSIYAEKDDLKIAIVQLVSHPSLDQINQGIQEQLKSKGYVVGENLFMEEYNAQGDMTLLNTLSKKVVQSQPDYIFAITTPVAQALQKNTKDIPIVLAGITDPVASKLVQSNEKPGDNISGISDYIPVKKQIEFIQEEFEQAKTIGFIYSTNEDNSQVEINEAKATAEQFGFQTKVMGISNSQDMQRVANKLSQEVDVIYTGSDNLIASSYDILVQVSETQHVPLISPVKELIDKGAYGGIAIDQKEIGTKSVDFMLTLINQSEKIDNQPIQRMEGIQPTYNQKVKDDFQNTMDELLPVLNMVQSLKNSIYIQAIGQGLIWSIFAIGLFISFRILKFADLTSEGSFTIGAAVSVMMMTQGYSVFVSMLAAMIAGMICGLLTGIWMSVLKIPGILASIITLTSIYSLNLIILGKPNVSLQGRATYYTVFNTLFGSNSLSLILSIILILLVLFTLLHYFFKTDFGLSLVATGDNEIMARTFGINTSLIKCLSLMLANGLIAFSGSLVSQNDGFADVSMGIGTVVIGLSSIVLGEVIFARETTLSRRFIYTIIGSIVYQLLLTIVLEMGVSPIYYKLVTAIILVVILSLPQFKNRLGGKIV